MSIQLTHISKKYDNILALNKVNLHFETGKTNVLIGPSGCGKSTLIRIITGLIKSDSGIVEINNEILSTENLISVRRKMGYVIQDGGLFPHLSARGNVSLLAKYLGWEKSQIEDRIKDLSDLTKFPASNLEKFPAELSGGQKQRVSLMRALMSDPPMLLLDEPLGALDPLIRYDLQTDLKVIFKSLQKTVIMVTHDMSEAAFFGDKIILMKEGSIVQEGDIDSLIKNPANEFVTRFFKAQRNTFNFEVKD